MKLLPKSIHPEDESTRKAIEVKNQPIEVETFDGKLYIEWDPDASVTPLGQLPFFIEYLKLGHRFLPWVDDCPLHYTSNNAPQKIDVLGSLFLSILSGHTRYAHMTTLMNDEVNTQLLGMNKIVSDDSARRALKRIDEAEGVSWMQKHLYASCEPLLTAPWILDVDTTIKPIYGHQEGAEIGYNPKKPGRPSHTYHTYMMATLRLVLDVIVKAGNESQSTHSLEGLFELLDKIPEGSKPYLVRGDCDWGIDSIMKELESRSQGYLFKLRKSKYVQDLILKHHGTGGWRYFQEGWEAKETTLQLSSWEKARRVVIVRQKISSPKETIALEYQVEGQLQFSLLEGPEDLTLFRYSVLVTNLDDDLISIVRYYRDRADCENQFDEIKNQWGWGGYTTRDLKSCRLMSKMIALIYNWWTLFVRLANPDNHLEAVTSRPLLLSSVGRLTKSGRQKKMLLTSQHGAHNTIQKYCYRIVDFFKTLKRIAPQLTPRACWEMILMKATEKFRVKNEPNHQRLLPLLT